MTTKGYSAFPKAPYHWNLTIRNFTVISRTQVGVESYPPSEVQSRDSAVPADRAISFLAIPFFSTSRLKCPDWQLMIFPLFGFVLSINTSALKRVNQKGKMLLYFLLMMSASYLLQMYSYRSFWPTDRTSTGTTITMDQSRPGSNSNESVLRTFWFLRPKAEQSEKLPCWMRL